MRIKFYAFCFVAFALVFIQKAFGQDVYMGTWGTLTEKPNTPINEMINGYIELLPSGYDPNGSQSYPLIIFLEGQSQFGDGGPTELKKLYGTNEAMFPDLIRNGDFPNNYNVDGTNYKFIALIPQARKQVQADRPPEEQMLSPEEVNDVVNYALQNYRVDVNRVYLMGLSLGGGSTWNYGGESVNYANRLAAIVPFAGASDPTDNPSRDDNIAAANLPVWTFVGENDATYKPLAQEYIDLINSHSPSSEALITIFPGGDHNSSWTEPLQNNNTGNSTYPYSDLFVWLLTKSRSLTQPDFVTLDAGADQTLNLPNGSMVLGTDNISFTGATVSLDGSAAAPAGRTIANIEWVRVDGNGGSITDPTSLSTDVTNLKPGNYTYQLRVTDDQGLTTVDNVSITVTKPPENKYYKIEAEDYTAVTGAQIEESYLDEGPASGLGYLGTGNSATYAVDVVNAGTYDLYYRYRTYGAQPIQIVVNGTVYNTSLSGTNAPNWTTSRLSGVELGNTNEIQFISQGNSWQNFNYFELGLTAADASLPVKFVYFNTDCSNGAVSVRWKTAQEQNSSSFTVQRSADGAHWTDAGTVAAAGQSSSERSYVFVDHASQVTSYYRVLEHDADGKISMTGTVKSICGATSTLSLYPNPNGGNGALSLQLQQGTSVTIQVTNASGVLVQRKDLQLPAGTSIIPVDISSQPNGIYTISVRYEQHAETLKMLKK